MTRVLDTLINFFKKDEHILVDMTDRLYICDMRRKVDRDQIIEKGLELMCTTGYEATGVKEIADATGMLKGSFYNYFSSKEEFATVLLETYSDRTYALTKEILSDTSTTPVVRLKNLFAKMWSSMNPPKEEFKGCFLGNFSQEIGNTNESLSSTVNQALVRIKKLYVECLKEAQAAGELDSSQDPDLMAEFIINSWQGVLLRVKSAKNFTAFESFKDQIFNRLLK